jgi:LacI family transcriptional regulator
MRAPLPSAAIADNVVSRVWSEGAALSNHADESGRRPTIKDVAREAGVSFKTVSRVMNRDAGVNAAMREAVEAAREALGYRPHHAARALRSSRTYTIALFAGSREEPGADARAAFPEYLGEVISGCAQACRPAGFHLVLELLAYGDRRRAASVAGALLDDLTPDGVVLTPPLCDLAWLLDILEQRAIAYVRLMPGAIPERGVCLSVDDFTAAKDSRPPLPPVPVRARGSAKATSSSLRASVRPRIS